MKKILTLAAVLSAWLTLAAFTACADGAAPDPGGDAVFSYTCLSQAECADALGGLDEYYQKLNQKSLDYFAQIKGATAEEYRAYSMEQALEFTEEERAFLDGAVRSVEEKMTAAGMKLPENRSVTFALTTMREAGNAGGYTHGTTVFLGKNTVDRCLSAGEKGEKTMEMLVSHELFHCLTRNNPDFRQDMYSIIHFHVTDSDFDIPDDVYEQMILNPDVGHHDSYAEFTIGGEKKKCYLVFLTKDSFEKPGDTFFSGMYTGLVDIDSGTLYASDEASDFWQVVGANTNYCEDPEECMATNFSCAVIYGIEGQDQKGYETPEIIGAIISRMQNR